MRFSQAIKLIGCDHRPLCHGFQLEIVDHEALAESIAWIVLGHFWHVEKVLRGLAPTIPQLRQSMKTSAAKAFQLAPDAADSLRWHRDGLVFQHISWMALQIQNKGRVAVSIPHPRPSNKGFDALMVPLQTTSTAQQVLFICEDKATDHPRDMIRDEVWPEIEKIENGERDPELTSELTALLLMYKIENADAVIAAANWAKRKSYKICVTVSPKEDSLNWRRKVFKGFDEKVADKDLGRRRADTLAIANLRQWMDQLCQKIEKAILTSGDLHV